MAYSNRFGSSLKRKSSLEAGVRLHIFASWSLVCDIKMQKSEKSLSLGK